MYRTVVTICTTILTFNNSTGHYMYHHFNSQQFHVLPTQLYLCLLCGSQNNIYTAQWSLCVPHSGHYMYRTVVTICTAQWSLYVPHSGHYMYRTVVTICTAQWSLYVPHSGHYMYRTVVTICTTILTFTTLRSAHTAVFMCFVWISEQTAIISLYNINWLVCITKTQSVYCAVQTGYTNPTDPDAVFSVHHIFCLEDKVSS